MDEKKMKALMIDFIDGQLKDELHEFVTNYIDKDEQAKKEYEELKKLMLIMDESRDFEPEVSLKDSFEKMLAEEAHQIQNIDGDDKVRHLTSSKTTFSISPIQIAASVALVLMGTLIGIWLVGQNSSKKDLLVLKNEMESTKQLIINSLQDKGSPSGRIMGINASMDMGNPDEDIITALTYTLDNDDNTNVRLAALEALKQFSDNHGVRRAFVASLTKQTEPIVQITLINTLVELKEKGATEVIQQLTQDETVIETVKDEAHLGLFKLL